MIYQVLIVDDEEIVCRGLAQFVKWKKYGFEVAATASSVDEALSVMKKSHIDVAFMDIRMPGKTGLELLRIIRQEYPDVKSVILSGYSDFSYAQEAIRNGAVDYLTKPVVLKDIEALLERLKNDFDAIQDDNRIRCNRMEALLLSAAKGYSKADAVRFNLPALESWYGLSLMLKDRKLSEEDITCKKNRCEGRFPPLCRLQFFLKMRCFPSSA